MIEAIEAIYAFSKKDFNGWIMFFCKKKWWKFSYFTIICIIFSYAFVLSCFSSCFQINIFTHFTDQFYFADDVFHSIVTSLSIIMDSITNVTLRYTLLP